MGKEESTFLNMIKQPCIDAWKEFKILPSIVAAIGAIISNWGTSQVFYSTRNIYKVPADENWNGKCYSLDTGAIYNSVSECNEPGAILLKVYTDHQNSVKDFTESLATTKRSENGPYKYASIIGCTDYKEALNRLDRAGYMNAILNVNELIRIIEDYKLFEYDYIAFKEDEEMSKKKNRNQNNNNNHDSNNTKEFIVEHMYRVRLDWDRRDTQIFASPNYDDALEEAKKHEGYKVYIDEGELFSDPWLVVKTEPEGPTDDEKLASIGIKKVVHPLPGKKVELAKTPVYRQALDPHPSMYLTGTFYYYDNIIVNGRAKIVKNYMNKMSPSMIIGYIKI